MSAENLRYCSVPTCKKDPKHSHFLLPKNPARAKMWMGKLGIEENTTRRVHVCEAHFESKFIHQSPNDLRKRLGRGAFPSLNLPQNALPQNAQNLNIKASDTYNNFVEDIIMKSLSSSSSQTNVSSINEPLDAAAESSCSSSKREHNENLDGKCKQNKQTTSLSSLSQNQTGMKDPFYVSKKITEIQKIIEIQKKNISENPDELKQLAFKVYLTCPQSYKMLLNTFQLPPISTLKTVFEGCSMSIENDTLFASILEHKVGIMSERQKHCIICLGEFYVDQKLYYDIKLDKVFGVSDINDIQKPEPACKALVLTVQGLFTEWKQPIDIAFTGSHKENDLPSINLWIKRSIRKLLEIGYNVRAFVSQTEYLTMSNSTYYQLMNHKIYYIYDVPYLFKMFYYDLLWHEFGFDGGIAKRQDLLDYYKLDSKQQFRLSPKLTAKVIKPASFHDLDENDVMKIISFDTAAAMSVYLDFKALNPSAKSMIQLITKMSELFEILHSNNCNESMKVASGQTYIEFLNSAYLFFFTFKIFHCTTKKEVPKGNTFVEKIQSTIRSILILYREIKLNDHSELFSTRRLSLDNVRSFYDRVKKLRKNCTKPTCKEMNSAFMQSKLLNVLKPINNDDKCIVPMELTLDRIKNVIEDFKSHPPKIGNIRIGTDIKINSSEYNKLDLRKKDAIVMLAGFLLKKCHDRHADCVAMKNYICIVLHDTSSICKTILNEIQQGVCVVPQESFIEFVEMMEIKFRSFMTKNILETIDGKFINGLLMAMQLVSFPMPCSCFPILYAKKLYLRLRIYNMLKFNNTILLNSSGKCKDGRLIVNNL